jgi:hypothetical protein
VRGGVLCFLVLLVFAAGTSFDIHMLLDGAPWLAVALAGGAMITFAPLVICVAVGSLARGPQEGPTLCGDDRPRNKSVGATSRDLQRNSDQREARFSPSET